MKPLAASQGGNGGGVDGKGVDSSVKALLRTTLPCQMQRPMLSSIQRRQGDEKVQLVGLPWLTMAYQCFCL